MALECVPFVDDCLDAAGALLAQRHRRDREAEPALPARFEEPAAARAAVEAIWRRPTALGVAALRDGRLAGYLLGTVEDLEVRGQRGMAGLAAHALDRDEPAGLYRDLYAALAPHWIAEGCFVHCVSLPARDRAARDAWFSLSFGMEQEYAACELTAADAAQLPVRMTPPAEIRRATVEDLERVVAVSDLVGRHYAESPVFSPFLPYPADEWRASWRELLEHPKVAVWVVEEGARVLGFQLHVPSEAHGDDPLAVPERTVVLNLAATRPEARGRGIGRALTEHAFAWDYAEGYRFCFTDWRTTNLEAARFWPARGFRPFVYRVTRYLDPRIVWAR